MAQKILLVLLCLCSAWMSNAKPVSKADAQLVAENFYRTTPRGNDIGALQLQIAQTVYTRLYKESSGQMEDVAVYYVFNVNSQDGFVMIAADDAAVPVLAYATEGHFDPTIEATNYLKWVESYKEQMHFIIDENIQATLDITENWSNLRKGIASNGRSASAVNPLLGNIKWNQNGGGSTPWNAQCPYDNSAGSRAVVGCVATAMAQIMKYWGHPAQGTGFHSYNHSTYGTQSVNYGSTTYNWSAMPDATSSSESAKLSYHCGVAVDMMYSPSGSGAYSADAKDAFKDYFDYKSSIDYLARSNYSSTAWKNLLKADLDSNKPLYYAGSGSGGGHAFVCDGYDNSDNFHYNWGWGGSYDGYFHIDALNPSGVGTGGGSGGFNSNHRIINGIEPNGGGGGGGGSAALNLYSNMTLTPASPIQYGTAFSVDVDIANTSGTNFSGDVAAALLDNNNSFVAFIETKTGESYTDGFYYSKTFASSNMTSTPAPGTYSIVLYQKATGAANWTLIGNGAYTNAKSLVIQMTNSGGMELYDNIVPATNPMVLGSTATVSTNFWNNSATSFTGKFSIDLHDMQGNWVMTIEERSLSLNAGNVFTNVLDFAMTNLSLPAGKEAGTYQLAAWMQPTGGSWELVGNGSYYNPIQVDIAEPALVGDAYENNNTAGNAYTLPTNFFANAASVSTPGANIHNGSDYDYYKLVLPPGYSYWIDANVLDSYNTSSGYTNDVLFSWDIGNGYSATFDNNTSGINLGNGGTITFQVASYYQGQMGSYEFQANITRGAVSVNKVVENEALRLYPVPAYDYLTLEFETIPEDLNQIEIFNALGQKVETISGSAIKDKVHHISTQNWSNGTYWMLLQSSDAITRKSFVVGR